MVADTSNQSGGAAAVENSTPRRPATTDQDDRVSPGGDTSGDTHSSSIPRGVTASTVLENRFEPRRIETQNLVFEPFLGILTPMTPEDRRLLEEVKALTEENSKVLKSIQRMNRTSAALKIIYWIVILGVSFGAFYFIQPYFDALKSAAGDTPGPSTNSFEELLKDL